MRPSIYLRLTLVLTAVGVVGLWQWRKHERKQEPYRIGVLLATSGERAAFDRPYLDGTLAAIDVANRSGGVAGHPLEAVVRNTQSDPATAALEAGSLARGGVGVTLGGASPDVRRAIEAALEPLGGLLVSPTSAEGLDESAALITLGSIPNQRVVPAASWAIRTHGPRVFLISNRGLLQHVVHATLQDHVRCVGGKIVGEAWIADGEKDVPAAVAAIVKATPDVILSGLGRPSTIAFTTALRAAGVKSSQTPTVHWLLRTGELPGVDAAALQGDFIFTGAVFETDLGEAFAKAYMSRSGGEPPDPRALSAGAALRLVRDAIERSGGAEATGVGAAMLGSTIEIASGPLAVDANARTSWREARIGRLGVGQGGVPNLTEVWSSDGPIRPRPWPVWRSRAEWMRFIAETSAAAARSTKEPTP